MLIKTLWQALKQKPLRKRLYFTLFILILFRLGAHITTPGVDSSIIRELGSIGLLQSLSLISGNAFKNFSLFALGISPYISASIIIQILQLDVVPIFTEWSKQGEIGRRKLNKATRWLTLGLAVLQGYGVVMMVSGATGYSVVISDSWQVYALVLLGVCAGSMVITWLSEQITDRGVGNGQTMIIVAGILATLPDFIINIWKSYLMKIKWDITSEKTWQYIGIITGVVLVLAVLMFVIIYVHQAEFRIPIQYSNREQGYGDMSYLPLKLNPSGVIPVIFASVIMTAPSFVENMFNIRSQQYTHFASFFDMTRWRGIVVYALVIILFSLMYSFIQINPEKTATQLVQSGSYIVNVRPGEESERYFGRLLSRLGSLGGVFLAIVACLPLIVGKFTQTSIDFALTGTSLLIVIAGALDVCNQLNGFVMKRQYKDLF